MEQLVNQLQEEAQEYLINSGRENELLSFEIFVNIEHSFANGLLCFNDMTTVTLHASIPPELLYEPDPQYFRF